MSLRFAQRSASQLGRVAARRTAGASARVQVSRRAASTSAGEHAKSSDLPWIVRPLVGHP